MGYRDSHDSARCCNEWVKVVGNRVVESIAQVSLEEPPT